MNITKKISKQISKISLALLSVLLIGYPTASFCRESYERPDVESYNAQITREYEQLRARLIRMIRSARLVGLPELEEVLQRLLARLDAHPADIVSVAQQILSVEQAERYRQQVIAAEIRRRQQS